MIRDCKCGGRIEYLSELHLIPKTNPQEAGFEGVCLKCSSMYYLKFKSYEYEKMKFEDDGYDDGKKEIIPV